MGELGSLPLPRIVKRAPPCPPAPTRTARSALTRGRSGARQVNSAQGSGYRLAADPLQALTRSRSPQCEADPAAEEETPNLLHAHRVRSPLHPHPPHETLRPPDHLRSFP